MCLHDLVGLVHEIFMDLRNHHQTHGLWQRSTQHPQKRWRGHYHDPLETLLPHSLLKFLRDPAREEPGLTLAGLAVTFAAGGVTPYRTPSSSAPGRVIEYATRTIGFEVTIV